MSEPARGRTGIVVLNWRNAPDTLECLTSLLRLEGAPFDLYVVDNASGDGSLERIREWCIEHVDPFLLREGRFDTASAALHLAGRSPGGPPAVALLASDANGGFSSGNNIGVRAALRDGCEYVWLLNNDVVVAPDALHALVSDAERHPRAGVLGACILEYFAPDTVQCLGGVRFNWFLTTKKPVGAGLPATAVEGQGESRYDYVMGASLFVPRRTFEQVGLLAEDYFLYHEELDLAQRCAAAGLEMRTVARARIWHKYGASAGSSADIRRKSTMSAFYGSRSAVLCTRRFRPAVLPVVLAARVARSATLAARGAGRLAVATLRGSVAGLLAPLAPPPRA